MAAVTVADKSQSGLFIPASSWYYESLVDEFTQHCERSPLVEFGDGYDLPADWRNLTSAHVENILGSSQVKNVNGTRSGLLGPTGVHATDFEAICMLVFKGRAK